MKKSTRQGNWARRWFRPDAGVVCLVVAWAGLFPVVHAATTWNGSSGYWSDSAKWNPAGVPGDGVDVLITNGSVLLTNATANLASLTISGATARLTFSNWDTALTATNVSIQDGAIVTHVTNSATTTNADGSWPADGRVYIVCGTNFDLQAGGTIDAEGRGYCGTNACGPGGGLQSGGSGTPANYGSGAGYGGSGGYGTCSGGSKVSGGSPYGLTNAPVAPGSAGGGSYAKGVGAAGGGAVRIDATNAAVTVNGTIKANGTVSTYVGGGGSGGAIYITCRTFEGTTNGYLTAKGANGKWGAGNAYSGCGGGGRIAVIYDQAAQSGLASQPTVRFNSAGASSPYNVPNSEEGTLYLPDMPTTDWSNFEGGRIFGVTNTSLASLSISNNANVVLAESCFVLKVTNTLTIDNATLKMGRGFNTNEFLPIITPGEYKQLDCDSLILTNAGCLYVYSGPTNTMTTNYGARVTVVNDIVIYNNSWIYPASEGTNGGSVFFNAKNVTILAGGGFNANGLGYSGGNGPGKGVGTGNYGGGGGYGGKGGKGFGGAGGNPNGITNAPISPGSGAGGLGYGLGGGGGLVWIKASGTVLLDGAIKANGGKPPSIYVAAGSGGGIFIVANVFRGAGQLSANGESAVDTGTLSYYSGGGGGGRIAVWHRMSEADQQTIMADPDNALANVPRLVITNDFAGTLFTGSCTASNGWSQSTLATTGTVVRLTIPPPKGTIFTVR
ncbi:MAG: hypothetical protein PHW60_06570 [Kiritimatiellae bacterium]|nr:hypothetical protein [Kiritimatiellia bacterium]